MDGSLGAKKTWVELLSMKYFEYRIHIMVLGENLCAPVLHKVASSIV